MAKDHDGFIGYVEIQEIFIEVSDSRAESLAHDAMPRRPVQFIHVYFNFCI